MLTPPQRDGNSFLRDWGIVEGILSQLRLVLSRVRRLNYRHVLPDTLIIVASLYLSLFLRLGADETGQFLPTLNRLLPLFLLLRLGTFVVTGVYDIIWRYVSINDALRLIQAIGVSSVLILAASYLVDIGRLPRAVFFIDTLLLVAMLPGIRSSRRLQFQSYSERMLRLTGCRTLIYGAGVIGRAVVSRLSTDSVAGFKVIGFVDDDCQKVGRVISGVKVLGSRRDLAAIIRDFKLAEVIVAVTNPSGELLRDVVQVCRAFGIQPRLATGATSAKKNLELIREIGLSDLLNRPPRTMDVSAIKHLIRNHRVLVTGAGGSIGSELARQILSFSPSGLVLLDHSEFNLYQIDQELREVASERSVVVPLLADVKDRATLANVFREHAPEVIFHAAAYKHVHLVEENPFSSILNNVLGTRNLLELSTEFDVKAFVLISTDKAVNPAGVMGATKRICELLVTDAGQRTGLRYCSVRFGNVLGSSGSLIPKLRQQLDNGEPLTITHKDMTRYFMLIPEAVALVLKAATIANPGDITVLRMGEPLKIVDVAKSLVALMGKSPDEVPIVYTGLRPGEKLCEELYLCGNEMKTDDPDILVLPRGDATTLVIHRESFHEDIAAIIDNARQGKKESVFIMSRVVKSNLRSSAAQEEGPATWVEPGDGEGMERFFRPGGRGQLPAGVLH